MKRHLAGALILALAAGQLRAEPQLQTGSIEGRVMRDGISDPVPGATVGLIPAVTAQAFERLIKAAESLVLPGIQQVIPQLLTMTVDESDDAITALKDLGLPADFVTALNDLQSAKSNTPGFPKHALTDNDGHFAVPNLSPGQYMVFAQRDGFFGKPLPGTENPRPFESTLATVTSDRSTSDIAIPLLAGAAIAGTVFDELKLPLIHADVEADVIAYSNGLPVLQRKAIQQTDEHGAYRISYLSPGAYLIAAYPLLSASSTLKDAPVETFYPDSFSTPKAIPVSVKLGDEVSGIDIHMQAVRAAKISGTVINGLGAPSVMPDGRSGTFPNATLQLVPQDSWLPDAIGMRDIGSIAMKDSVGTFTVPGVLPGIYDLYAQISDPRGTPGREGMSKAWGRTTVEVRDRDIDAITLTIHPSFDVTGTMTIDGKVFNGVKSNVRVSLRAEGSASKLSNYQEVQNRAQTPDLRGTFTIPAVAEGTYRFQVLNLSGNDYVDEIRQGVRSVFDSGIAVGDRIPEPIAVMVKSDGGWIEGNVIRPNREPFAASTVVLIPELPDRQNSTLFRAAISDSQGHFSIRGIRPGSYSLLAFQSIPAGAYWNPSFLSKYESQSMTLTIAPQSMNSAELTVISGN